MYVCLAVTCHLHLRQNDRDLLHVTAVTRGWNGYRNKSQHRKLTLEKKILPPLLPGLKPGTFQSRVRRSNHWAIHAPRMHTLNNVCFNQTALVVTLNFTTSQMVESFVQKIHCIPGCYELSFYVNSHGSLCICMFMIQTHERFKRMLIYLDINTPIDSLCHNK